MDVPNLDNDPTIDLMAFWAKHQRGRAARALFPAGGPAARRATADLANYASNLHAARTCRLRGEIDRALVYEGIADRIYRQLPAFARW